MISKELINNLNYIEKWFFFTVLPNCILKTGSKR